MNNRIEQDRAAKEKALGCSLSKHSIAVKRWLAECEKTGKFVPFYTFLESVK